jgi:osmotically-inducible protein OsmY
VVTLAGFAESWADRWKAERVASRVRGVKGVANDIRVKLPSSSERPDPELARAAVDALKWNVLVPDDRIRVKVANGWLTLEGEVDWYYQKEEAERAVRKLRGVKGVTNLVTVAVRPASSDVKEKIRNALERGAELDADRIRVEVEGSRVILRGTVRSYTEKRDAERAARNAPGVTEVENLIIVDPLVPAAV